MDTLIPDSMKKKKIIIIKTDIDNIKHMGQGKLVLADWELGGMYSVSVCSKQN